MSLVSEHEDNTQIKCQSNTGSHVANQPKQRDHEKRIQEPQQEVEQLPQTVDDLYRTTK